MKAIIRLSGIHKYGVLYSVEMEDKKGEFDYYYGLENLKKGFLSHFEGDIELKESAGFKEHSELIKILEDRGNKEKNKNGI